MVDPMEDPNAQGLGGDFGAAGVPGEGGEEEGVDQYFDDGGETFLPADHVSNLKSFIACNWPILYLALDGTTAKRFD